MGIILTMVARQVPDTTNRERISGDYKNDLRRIAPVTCVFNLAASRNTLAWYENVFGITVSLLKDQTVTGRFPPQDQ